MNWLRLAGRSLLAGHFVRHGVAAIRHPAALVESAEPMIQWATEVADRTLPAASRRLPSRSLTWVRLHGAVEAVGGLMMASGLGRRLGAVLVVGSQVPHVVVAARRRIDDAEGAGEDLAREAALLGAALIEALDTQGRPSLAWRAAQGNRRRAARDRSTGVPTRSEARA
jgi:uncharacterized membrane protein YphA (DoxX/SURF4 family)